MLLANEEFARRYSPSPGATPRRQVLLPAGRRFGTLASCQLEEKQLAHQGVDDGLARRPAPCSWALGFNGGQEVERAADTARPARVGSRQRSSRLASPLGRLFSAPQAPGPWTPAGRPLQCLRHWAGAVRGPQFPSPSRGTSGTPQRSAPTCNSRRQSVPCASPNADVCHS